MAKSDGSQKLLYLNVLVTKSTELLNEWRAYIYII